MDASELLWLVKSASQDKVMFEPVHLSEPKESYYLICMTL